MARRKRKVAAKANKKSPKAEEDDQIEEEVDLNDSQTGEDASAESQEDTPADPQEENNADISTEMQEDTAAASANISENTSEKDNNVLPEENNELISEEGTKAVAEDKIETDDQVALQTPGDETEMDTSEVQSTTTPVEASQNQSLVGDAGKDNDDVIMVESENKENEPSVKIDLTEDDNKVGMEVDDKDSVKKESVVLYVPKYIDYDDENVVIDIDPEFDILNEKVEGDESDDFLKYWRTVSDSPHDFTSWTYLLQLVEQESKIHLGRRAYNHFFKRYPLCYGYWKKFSEFERKNGNLARAQKILERGVRAIPLSVDLWMHVIDFYTNHYKGLDAGKNKVKRVYERALKSAGAEFRSEKLWNKYIQWELVNNDWKAVLDIYDRAIRTQTQHYSVFFNDFKEFVNTHLPKEWMSEDEYNKSLEQVREANEAIKKEKQEEETKDDKEKETDAEDETKEADGDDDDDEIEPPGDDDIVKAATDQEITSIRLNYIKEKKKVYDETEQAVTKIWAFEEGIKRPYFHVKQLERAQLKNWREYLDMEINRENHNKVILLFERCLIACALYEDFWLKYAKYMAKFDAEKSREIYKRACNTHLPKKPNIHMQWAAFEELHGNVEESSRILKQLNITLPGMAMIRMRRVAVERRAGNYEVAEELLKAYVASAAKDKEEVFYTRKLAWFYFKISNKRDEARKLMKDLIPKYKSDVRLYNDLVEMEFQMAGASTPANDDEERLAIEAFDIALRSDKLTDEQKNSFSQRKVEFLEDYGLDVKRLQKAYDEHQKVLRNQKKRAQTEAAEGNQAKKAKTDTAAISVLGSTQPAANGDPYTASTTAAAAANYTNPLAQQAGYPGGDPNLYYQQNYWNYQQKPGDPAAAAQYNYSQWGQYYAQQQQQQQPQ